MKKCIILGITGQIGSYLADYLLDKDYEVHGIARRVSTPNYKNILHCINDIKLYDGDLTDLSSLISVFKEVQPDEIYNLAAQSFVAISWNEPVLTANVTGVGALNVFEAARQVCKDAKIYHAATSEMFDGVTYPQNENTPFKPKSPYGISKLFSFQMAQCYKESYGMFISCGIMFNSESPRRGIEFITQKIVDAVVRQVCGENLVLELGNIDTKRDWSHTLDTVNGIWLMLQNDHPDNYVLASGETHSIMEFIEKVYQYFNIDIIWIKDSKGYFIGYDSDERVLVKSVEKFYRLNDVQTLLGDATKARKELGWYPQYSFSALIEDMIEARLEEYRK